MTPLDLAEIARRVNAKLAEQAKPGTMPEVFGTYRVAMPEVVSAVRVEIVLANGTGRHHDLIREIAAEVEKERGK